MRRCEIAFFIALLAAAPGTAHLAPEAATETAQDLEDVAHQAPERAFDMRWWTVDGGGGTSTRGESSLTGTVGQPESGAATAAATALDGGFWATVLDLSAIFSDGFESGDTGQWSSATEGAGHPKKGGR